MSLENHSGVSKENVFAWKMNAATILSIELTCCRAQKLNRIKEGAFTEIEKYLPLYMRLRIVYIRGESLSEKQLYFRLPMKLLLK